MVVRVFIELFKYFNRMNKATFKITKQNIFKEKIFIYKKKSRKHVYTFHTQM
jgi:hypothetical protein